MESYRFLKRNIDGNFKSCIISLTEPTTPLIFMRNPVGLFNLLKKLADKKILEYIEFLCYSIHRIKL